MEKIRKRLEQLLKDEYHSQMSEVYFCLFNASQIGSGARFTGIEDIQHFFNNNLLTDDLDEYMTYLDKARMDNSGFLLGVIGKVHDVYFMTVPNIQISATKVKTLRAKDKPDVLKRFCPKWVWDLPQKELSDILKIMNKAKVKAYINELK